MAGTPTSPQRTGCCGDGTPPPGGSTRCQRWATALAKAWSACHLTAGYLSYAMGPAAAALATSPTPGRCTASVPVLSQDSLLARPHSAPTAGLSPSATTTARE